jgi:hypothetical protein
VAATRALVRHFLGSFLGRGVLEDEGIESVRAVFFSVIAMLATVGLFLPRQFHAIYTDLASNPERYQRALLADGFFMLSLPFLLAVFVAALVAPAMFPDEVDYITRVPLPLSRRRICAAKLAALTIFAAAVLGGLTAFTSIAFPGFTHQSVAEASLGARTVAHAAASLVSGTLGFALVVALQGLTLILTPQRWVPRVSVAVQCVCVAGVILAAPLALQMTAHRAWIATQPEVLFWVPPAWALGLEQWLSGIADGYWTAMARMATYGLVLVISVSLVAYTLLYRHAERLILPAPPAARGATRDRIQRAPGVWHFTRVTLARNRLPLLLFLVFVASAVAIMGIELVESASSLSSRTGLGASLHLGVTAVRLPLVLMLLGIVGLRMAFLVPVMSRANWIFRVTDGPDTRREHLKVVDRALLRWVVLPAWVVGVPLQVLAMEWASVISLSLTALIGAVLVELFLAGWRRVPFTCSWIPGQRPLVFIFFVSVGALILVAGLLPTLVVVSAIRSTGLLLIFGTVLAVTAGLLRWRRVETWANQPLLFEDERYDKLQTLGLTR